MDEPGRLIARNRSRQPRNQLLHLRDVPGARGFVLLRPPGNLPRKVVSRPSEVGEAEAHVIETVQTRECRVDAIEHCRALIRAQIRHRALEGYPAWNV